MKKILLMILFICVCSLVSCGKEEEIAEYEYYLLFEKNDTGYTINWCDRNKKDVELPSEYNGLPVTSIGKSAFEGCCITSIEIPNTVTSIEDYAFKNCENLENILVSKNLITIGEEAFKGCNNIKYTEYKNGKYIGSSDNPYMVMIGVIDETVTSFEINNTCEILTGALKRCGNLESIEIPEGVKSIGVREFRECWNLKIIVIPSTVKSIGIVAFGISNIEVIYNNSDIVLDENRDFPYYISDKTKVYDKGEWSYVNGVPTPNK